MSETNTNPEARDVIAREVHRLSPNTIDDEGWPDDGCASCFLDADAIIAALSAQGLVIVPRAETGCEDCGRPYGDEHGFPDLIIPFDVWVRISPTGDDGGLLCPSCICKRLSDQGIRCEGSFMSGPIISVSQATMYALRRIENIELALSGRKNTFGVELDQTVARIIANLTKEPKP